MVHGLTNKPTVATCCVVYLIWWKVEGHMWGTFHINSKDPEQGDVWCHSFSAVTCLWSIPRPRGGTRGQGKWKWKKKKQILIMFRPKGKKHSHAGWRQLIRTCDHGSSRFLPKQHCDEQKQFNSVLGEHGLNFRKIRIRQKNCNQVISVDEGQIRLMA